MTETSTVLATAPAPTLPEAVEQALVNGNLGQLSAEQRVVLYKQTCDSMGLNPLTTPFAYITLNQKLVLYATRNCTDQLRKVHNVDVAITSRERLDDIYVVTARAKLPNGRTDEEIGAVSVAGLRGESLANAMMKAGTKAKRRVTLSIVGLSMLDETEVETIPGAKLFTETPALVSGDADSSPAGVQAAPVVVDAATGTAAEPRALGTGAPAGGDYREPTEDEWTVFYDAVKDATGYSVADVATLLGRSAEAHLRALHDAGTPKSGKALKADLIAHKREGRAIPGVKYAAAPTPPAPSAAVQALRDDIPGCAVCGNELEETKFRDGTSWTPADLARISERKHGKPLCMTHHRAFNAAKLGKSGELAEATAR